jgi:hypothetical protein
LTARTSRRTFVSITPWRRLGNFQPVVLADEIASSLFQFMAGPAEI